MVPEVLFLQGLFPHPAGCLLSFKIGRLILNEPLHKEYPYKEEQ